MFQKRRKIGDVYKTETDWGEVFGVIVVIVILIAVFA